MTKVGFDLMDGDNMFGEHEYEVTFTRHMTVRVSAGTPDEALERAEEGDYEDEEHTDDTFDAERVHDA